MTQTASNMSKSLADENRSRDVRRRIEVIHKKLADLQELGIPCAFCYSSARNTGSIFTLGDPRITDVIERHKNEILVNLSGDNLEQNECNKSEIHLILPPLPSPLEELSRPTLQSLIVGITKDLGLKWTDPTPSWWPLDVPFVHPRSLPQSYYGNLVQALRKVLKSVYSYFSYDITNYIANQLEHDSDNLTTTNHVNRIQPQAKMNAESEEREERETPGSRHLTNNQDGTEASLENKRPTKIISNFTVENILSGPQHSSSSSSQSPSSTSTCSSHTSPTDYSSILPSNWVSHPPVKYTKYTMLSPGSMGDDKIKKKGKAETSTTSSSRQRHHSSSLETSSSGPETQKLIMRRVPSNPIARPTPTSEQLHFNFSTKLHSANGHQMSKPVPPEDPKSSQVNSFSQSSTMLTKSVSTLPVIQAIPYSTSPGKAVLQQNFPPSQQFVLLVPSTTTSVGEHLSGHSINPTKVTNSEQTSESNSPSHNHLNSEMDKRLLELTYRPIAPKSKSGAVLYSPANLSTGHKKAYKKPSATKPQKLRFHMTTVVKRPKHSSVMTSSMTVESPSLINERTKTTSFILDPNTSTELVGEKYITRAKNSYSNEKQAEESHTAGKAEDSPQSMASNEDTTANPQTNDDIDQHSSSNQSPKTAQQESYDSNNKDKLTFTHYQEDKQFELPNDNGRTTRSYTRRKRELTFHLYEDPETAFKTKRNCKE